MASAENTPAHIEPTEDGSALRIEWKDGHVSVYQPFRLRMLCPCAGCVDEVTGLRTLTSAMVPDDVYPQAIHYVGRYALQFIWSDGHQAGFYTYDLLRSLCDCEICGPAAE